MLSWFLHPLWPAAQVIDMDSNHSGSERLVNSGLACWWWVRVKGKGIPLSSQTPGQGPSQGLPLPVAPSWGCKSTSTPQTLGWLCLHTSPEVIRTGNHSAHTGGVDLLAGILLALCKHALVSGEKQIHLQGICCRQVLHSSKLNLLPLRTLFWSACLPQNMAKGTEPGTSVFTGRQNNKVLGAVSVSTFCDIALFLCESSVMLYLYVCCDSGSTSLSCKLW